MGKTKQNVPSHKFIPLVSGRSHYSFFMSPARAEAWRLASLGKYEEAYRVEKSASPGNRASLMRPMQYPPLNRLPVWEGEPLVAGQTLLLHERQGFGDTIQFARYLPLVRECVGKDACMLFAAPDWLLPILSPHLTDGFRFLSVSDRHGELPPNVPYPVAVSCLMPLPFLLGPLSMEQPYLQADGGRVAWWSDQLRARFPGKKLIGLAPTAEERESNVLCLSPETRRSCPPAAFALLVKSLDESAVCFSLVPRAVQGIPGTASLLPDGSCPLTSWSETAAIVTALDAVVSVDTAVCHLAGALGKPVHTLLSYSPDWRFGGREVMDATTHWYPTMRLYRQDKPGNWKRPIEQVIDHLNANNYY